MIKLTINNKEVKAKKGETVLEVCEREDIYVPTLCYQKGLSPYGGCRLCIVEVEGLPRPATACTLPVEDSMRIKTDTPLLKQLRRFTLQLILSEHPHACLICDKKEDCAKYQVCIQKSAITFGCKFCSQNGNCELQKLTEYLEIKEIPFTFDYRNLEIERYDPFFDRDYNLCILCGRCVRTCNEIRGATIIDFHHRGQKTLVGTPFSRLHLDAKCQFCGACVDVCPTGALRQRFGKWDGQTQRSVKSTCVLCSIGCSINLNVTDNRITSSTPDNNQICVRGRFGIAPIVHHPKRTTAPMLKKDKRIVEIDWEPAINYVASKLQEHKDKIGIIFSPQLTIEVIDLLYCLAANLKCSITTPLDVENNLAPLNLKEFTMESAFVIVNTDMIGDFSPLLLKLRSKKALLIVIDAMKGKTAEMADLWLRPKLGQEANILKLLFGQTKMNNTTGVFNQDIALAKNLLVGKKVALLYNAQNIKHIDVPKSVRLMPLASQINNLKIFGHGMNCTIEDLLSNKNIECLYLVGVAPKLDREYKTVIVQDCFSPSFEFDLFLPGATFAETNGTIINLDGETKKLQKSIEPLGKSKPDDWIIEEVAKILKFDLNGNRPKYRRGTSPTTSKNIKASKGYPYYLIVRENCYVFRGQPLSRLMKGFERLRLDNYVWISNSIAEKLKVKNGMEIKIIGKDLAIKMPVNISETVHDNSALIYAHPSIGIIESQSVRLECIK